jgi:hypothetical protein
MAKKLEKIELIKKKGDKKMIVKTKIELEVQGDFYIAYFRDDKNTLGDKSAVYFAKNVTQVKKCEEEAHGEPVIIKKVLPRNLKNHKRKDGQTLQQALKNKMKSSNSVKLPVCVGLYI